MNWKVCVQIAKIARIAIVFMTIDSSGSKLAIGHLKWLLFVKLVNQLKQILVFLWEIDDS